MDNTLILVINLPHRFDRLELIKKELVDYNYIVIEAIKTNLGCNLSHQKCIKYAIENNLEQVCIMEDDFHFIRKDKIILPKNFDMFFIGGDISDFYNQKIENSKRLKKPLRRAECYIIKKHYYQKFLNMLQECWDKLLKDPDNINYRLDMYWDKLIDTDNWRINEKGVYGAQRAGYSDIKQKYIKRSISLGLNRNINFI
tara:strand:+ start:2490 stop:3086 length:597 start_codon:yes stop_codon:yes gene_type:complete